MCQDKSFWVPCEWKALLKTTVWLHGNSARTQKWKRGPLKTTSHKHGPVTPRGGVATGPHLWRGQWHRASWFTNIKRCNRTEIESPRVRLGLAEGTCKGADSRRGVGDCDTEWPWLASWPPWPLGAPHYGCTGTSASQQYRGNTSSPRARHGGRNREEGAHRSQCRVWGDRWENRSWQHPHLPVGSTGQWLLLIRLSFPKCLGRTKL